MEDLYEVISQIITPPNGKKYFVLNGINLDHDYLLGITMKEPTELMVFEARMGEEGILETREYKGEDYQYILNILINHDKINKTLKDARERATVQGTTQSSIEDLT